MKRLLLAALFLAAACSSHSSHSSFLSQSSTAPTTSATTPAATASPPTSASLPSGADLARLHAPIYRFNAWQPVDSSPQNRDEDFFPESVARFFAELASQHPRVTTTLAERANVGISEVVSATDPVSLDANEIHGMPQRMAGDPPGQAPVYFHAFEDTSQRVRSADGSGEDLWYVEFWIFYPKDLSLVTIGSLPTPLAIGGHRGDWESTSFAIAVVRGAGGSFQRSEIRRGYFNGHHDKFRCARAELELQNEHPVVYVSCGKHASYPEPGKWLDRFLLSPAVHFDEFFLGDGFEWTAAQGPLIDLDGPPSVEFSPPGLLAIPSPYQDWRDFPGGWGPDPDFGPLSGSPVGPRFAKVHDQGDAGAQDWASVKATNPPGLTLGAVAPVVPAPVPIRR